MKRKILVSIGIPAYNEQANITSLLKSLLAQKQKNFNLEKIVVISDGSTDKTVQKAKSANDKRIKVIARKTRQGQTIRQNEIFNKSNADFVILLNADTLIKDDQFLSQIINTFTHTKNIGMVAPKTTPYKSKTLIGKILEWHSHWKQQLYESIKNQNNIYLCKGAARGFSKKVYKNLKWPKVYAEDAFSYLYLRKLKLQFAYCNNTEIYYQTPQNLKDHIRQSVRFLLSQKELRKYFTQKELNRAYKMPKSLFLSFAIKGLLSNPINALSYIFIHAYCKLLALTGKPNSQAHLWEISTSTKTISNN